MPRDYPRRYRVADQVQRELGELLRGVKDPRVQGLVTVSGIDVSPDLRHAKIFVTVLESDDPEATVVALNGAAGYLRGRLGDRLEMRRVPQLVFHYDASLDQADRVERLLRDVRGRDR
ncbi:MAG: 30S ribosome-binding factor RbfA [Halofilum sp. (in: g-proteobacteria)]|nr:30S ribosome-binding factor RbfA [Halofilum sp. (in: g-proteobacteria)]